MLSAAHKTVDVSPRRGTEADPTPSHQMDDTASWFHCHISTLPDEVLSHIFHHLECDDIVRIHNTCQKFRNVVQAGHMQAHWFNRLPQRFRQQFPKSRSWLKQMVQDGLHPFTTRLPVRQSESLNAQQQDAVMCFHILGEMMSTPGYRPRVVIASDLGPVLIGYSFARTSSDILIYFVSDAGGIFLGQNDSGLWSEQIIEINRTHLEFPQSVVSYRRVSFSPDGRYFSALGLNDIQIYKRDSGTWQLVNRQQLGTVNWLEVSSSGKYLVASGRSAGIGSIRYFDEQECWNPMPLAMEINACVEQVEFSSSEQHLFIKYKRKMVILSLDSQGCWNSSWQTTLPRCIRRVYVEFSPSEQLIAIRYGGKVKVLSLNSRGCWNTSWETRSDQKIKYAKLCPSGCWLLIAYHKTMAHDGSTEMIELNRSGKFVSRQIISRQNLELTFSLGGNYLFRKKTSGQHLLWGLAKSGQWLSYGDLTDWGAFLWQGPGHAKSGLATIAFSPCDNYLFTSTEDGAVKIWQQDEQERWMVRGSEQCDLPVHWVRFSNSGVHALANCRQSIRIWGRDDSGFWSVKGTIPATGVMMVDFHPVAEHLIFLWRTSGVQVWEIRKCLEP